MKELNNYLYQTFYLIYLAHRQGLIEKPYIYKMHKTDKKVLKEIYNRDKLYINKISLREYLQICVNYSTQTGKNIIVSGLDCADELKKLK